MGIAFEEKDRTEIEANGMMIVEFKRLLYRLAEIIKEIIDTIKKALEALSPVSRSD